MLRDPEHRHGDYRCTEPRLAAVARLIRIVGTPLSDLIGSLLRLRTKSREGIRLVTHATQSGGFIVEPVSGRTRGILAANHQVIPLKARR